MRPPEEEEENEEEEEENEGLAYISARNGPGRVGLSPSYQPL